MISSEQNALSQYLKHVGQWKLLTSQEEWLLSRKIEQGIAARKRLSEDPDLTLQEERVLRRISDQGESAREHMANANLRLVVNYAMSYTKRSNSHRRILDLIQAGNEGLMKATWGYDWRRGWRFSTYATYWIRQLIISEGQQANSSMRIPAHVRSSSAKMWKEVARLRAQGKEPTNEELAQIMEMEVDDIKRIKRATAPTLSLDQEDENERTLQNYIPDESAGHYESKIAMREAISAGLQALTEVQRTAVALRFGTDGQNPHTLREVAERMGRSEGEMRGILRNALKRFGAVVHVSGITHQQ